jgi:16S rRNA (cytosine967-C5)-methyltransferase
VRLASLYGHAVELLSAALGGRRPVDDLSGEFFRSRRYLGAKDRRFIGDVTYGVIRHHLRLRYVASRALRSLGFHSDDVPAAALVALRCAEEPASSPEGWEAALAEIWPAEGLPLPAELLPALASVSLPDRDAVTVEHLLSLRHSIPEFVVHDWVRQWGEKEAGLLCEASNLQAPVTLRVNTLRCTRRECADALKREGLDPQEGSMAVESLRLPGRAALQSTQAFRDGWCEVQDEGSQWISHVAGVSPGMVVIDACAGAGGKTLHLAALMENRGRIIAVDMNRRKLRELESRSRRSGAEIISVALSDDGCPPSRFGADPADVVFIDAPCSGTGTFRRSPWLKLTCSPEAVSRTAALQRTLLEAWAPLVRQGGRLVYATCSLLQAENQENMEWFLSTHRGFAPAGGDTAAEAATGYLLPHRDGTDGFFSAVFTRL